MRATRHSSALENTRVTREAFTLPLIFLSVGLMGGFRATLGESVPRFLVPPLVTMLLAIMLLWSLTRSGVLALDALVGPHRSSLANVSGGIVVLTLFFAAVQVLALVTPEVGFLHFIVSVFLAVQLWTTLAAQPDRPKLLRALAVVLGGTFAVKFVILSALYDPSGGLAKRVLVTLLEGASLGALEYQPYAAVTGYVAFFTLALFIVGLILLPPPDVESED